MKVLVLGDGLLGSEIVRQTNWSFLSRKIHKFEITKLLDFKNILVNYDVIVNCIAFTKTYDDNQLDNWNINYVAVDQLVEFCNLHNIKLIHISTDYIYSGSVSQASEEDVPVHLPTWYGYTKLLGDGLVQLRCKNFLICRLSHKPNPFPYDGAWTDQLTNCDYVDKISEIVIQLILSNESGVYNVGTESKSIFDLAKRTKPDVIPINRPNLAPQDISMNVRKLNLFYNSL
jgi:dTDP-4-dehydrorhamnose reductase